MIKNQDGQDYFRIFMIPGNKFPGYFLSSLWDYIDFPGKYYYIEIRLIIINQIICQFNILMKTDKELYRLFASMPDYLFECAGIKVSETYEMKSVTFKEFEQRSDGLLEPVSNRILKTEV
ncbi:DUF2887 [Desulfonema limicola]|uniref:DUF2887 n=1 Tax=Desulfonema limicola TaxID=45656 RepID=A0A975GFC3_9BACT|nr:DUF2887 domain-containing protein [Desulfonema limicola]QTA79136.1 DUF2887 [Desulfonema limicola]